MTIVEDEERLDEEVEYSELDDVAEEPAVAEQPPAPEPEEDIPEKYRGKSPQEIIRMHQEAEKLLGRQSSEVGELRKVVDSYIQTQLSEKQAPEPVDFFDDPETAVSRAIENHPKVKEAEQVTNEYRKTTALNKLQSKYPDMMETVQNPEFQEWVRSSKIRTQLMILADQQYNYDAADELLSNWKDRQKTVGEAVVAEREARKQTVKKAATGNPRGTGETTRKVYRRSDIIKLMQTDPDRYEALSDEIMAAYREGRVK